jgi:hypothetical protein
MSLFETSSSDNHGTANRIREMWLLVMSQEDKWRCAIHAVPSKDPKDAATTSEKTLKEKSTNRNVEHPRKAKHS